jgi:hypothetical protein
MESFTNKHQSLSSHTVILREYNCRFYLITSPEIVILHLCENEQLQYFKKNFVSNFVNSQTNMLSKCF